MSGGACPVSARRIRIQIAADEPELVDAALELGDAVGQRIARRLRQLADADEVLREQLTDAMDQVVAVPRPVEAGARIADVMRHRRRARREDRDVGAAIALELQLRLHALAQLVVGDRRPDRTASRPMDPSAPAICASRNAWSSFGAVV